MENGTTKRYKYCHNGEVEYFDDHSKALERVSSEMQSLWLQDLCESSEIRIVRTGYFVSRWEVYSNDKFITLFSIECIDK